MRSLSGSNLNRESELSGAVAGRVGTAIGQANRTHQVSWDPRQDHAAGLFVYQQIEAARLDIEQLRREGNPPTAGLRREEMRR